MIDFSKKEEKKILIISPWGIGGGYSGPILLLNRLFEGLTKANVSASVIYRDRGDEAVPEWPFNLFPIGLGGGKRPSILASAIWVLKTRMLLAKHGDDYDYLHLHGTYLLNILCVVFSKHVHKVVLFPVLENGDLATNKGGVAAAIKRSLQRRVVTLAQHSMALSSGIEQELLCLGADADRITRLPNVVDIDRFYPAEQVAQQPPLHTPILGFVGKLGPIKRPDLILDALFKLHTEGIQARAIFVGPFVDVAYERKFRQSVKRLGLVDFVSLVGYTEDVSGIFRKMDIFVLPSSAEGMPGALIEAMATGLPILVTNAGSMVEIATNSGAGYEIEATGIGIADGVRRLMGDKTNWVEMRKKARLYAEIEFSHDLVAQKYLISITDS